MGDGLLLLPSKDGGVYARSCLIQGLACCSHGSDESLLLSVCGSSDGLSRGHGHGVVLLPLDGGGGDLLPIDNAEVGVAVSMVSKTVMVRGGGGQRRTLGLGQR
jgi:hypothetical protein